MFEAYMLESVHGRLRVNVFVMKTLSTKIYENSNNVTISQ